MPFPLRFPEFTFIFYFIDGLIDCGTGVWTQGLQLELLNQPFFVMNFFELGSFELFAQAGFEPQSSWSLPPE
jgi:hypothetical protein